MQLRVNDAARRCARAGRVLAALPLGVAREVERLAAGRAGGLASLCEVRLRLGSPCEIILGDERLILGTRVGAEELAECVRRVSDGGLYAHRDTIAEGYLPMAGGVRVGISGRARYDGGRVVGISDVSSLVFRIPGGVCDFSAQLEAAWGDGVRRGMLIYSPPGGGKTTALRHLAGYLGGPRGMRVAVVDERCELDPEDYADARVDILSGYRKAEGLEIATRTLSPEVVLLDELGASDADAVMAAIGCGVPVVATAHAGELAELLSRRGIRELCECGAFDVFVGILNTPPTYSLKITRNETAGETEDATA